MADRAFAGLRHRAAVEIVVLVACSPFVLVVVGIEVGPVGEQHGDTDRGRVRDGGIGEERGWV